MGSMKKLAENQFWRDGFKDQLTVAFKDSILTSVKSNNDKFQQSAKFLDEVIAGEMESFGNTKARIKRNMDLINDKRERSRIIESADKRIVHFIFDPQQVCKETPFSKKFVKMMAGELDEF